MKNVNVNLLIKEYSDKSKGAFLKYQAHKESKVVYDASTKIGWIESEDKCDPETLKMAPEVSDTMRKIVYNSHSTPD